MQFRNVTCLPNFIDVLFFFDVMASLIFCLLPFIWNTVQFFKRHHLLLWFHIDNLNYGVFVNQSYLFLASFVEDPKSHFSLSPLHFCLPLYQKAEVCAQTMKEWRISKRSVVLLRRQQASISSSLEFRITVCFVYIYMPFFFLSFFSFGVLIFFFY